MLTHIQYVTEWKDKDTRVLQITTATPDLYNPELPALVRFQDAGTGILLYYNYITTAADRVLIVDKPRQRIELSIDLAASYLKCYRNKPVFLTVSGAYVGIMNSSGYPIMILPSSQLTTKVKFVQE